MQMFLKLCLVVHKNTIKHNPTFKLVNSTKSFEHSQRFVEHAVQYQHIRTMRLSTDFWSIKMKKIKNRFFLQDNNSPGGELPWTFDEGTKICSKSISTLRFCSARPLDVATFSIFQLKPVLFTVLITFGFLKRKRKNKRSWMSAWMSSCSPPLPRFVLHQILLILACFFPQRSW